MLIFALLCLYGQVLALATLRGTIYNSAATAQHPAQPGNFEPGATVTLASASEVYTASIQIDGAFEMELLSGSYRMSIFTTTSSFPSYRVDVSEGTDDEVKVYQRTSGTPWSAVGPRLEQPVQIYPTGSLEYYTPRPSANLLKMLSSPYAWIGLVMVFSLFVLPKLTEWMDPEGMAEMERIKEEKKREGATQEPKTNPVEQLQNFDMSGWLAGRK
jgi:hypothetical protein